MIGLNKQLTVCKSIISRLLKSGKLLNWRRHLRVSESESRINLFFDKEFYEANLSSLGVSTQDSFNHFATFGFQAGIRPSAFMDPVYCQRTYGCSDLTDLIQVIEKDLQFRSCFEFDPVYYQQRYSDLQGAVSTYIEHYVSIGWQEGRIISQDIPAPIFRKPRFEDVMPPTVLEFCEKLTSAYLDNPLKVALLIGHEATLTGAPMLLKQLGEYWNATGIKTFTLLKRPGSIAQDYRDSGPLVILDDLPYPLFTLGMILNRICRKIDTKKLPIVVNTLAIPEIIRMLNAYGMKSTTLVHEFASFYPIKSLSEYSKTSNLIVFSSKSTRSNACSYGFFDDQKSTIVLGQGLVKVGQKVCGSKAGLKERLGLAHNEQLVIAAGSMGYRKGSDLFLGTAIQYFKANQNEFTVFIWIGARNRPFEPGSVEQAFEWDIEKSGLTGKVFLLESDPNLEDLLKEASVFLLTSRQDPFPCIVQNALALGVPVLAFQGAGGTDELIGEFNMTVPYSDTSAMASQVATILNDTEYLSIWRTKGPELIANSFQFQSYSDKLWQLTVNSLNIT